MEPKGNAIPWCVFAGADIRIPIFQWPSFYLTMAPTQTLLCERISARSIIRPYPLPEAPAGRI